MLTADAAPKSAPLAQHASGFPAPIIKTADQLQHMRVQQIAAAAYLQRAKRSAPAARIKAIKSTHIVGRLALAIINEAETHGIVERLALRNAGFTVADIDQYWHDAFTLARAYRPHLLNGKQGIWS